MNNVETVLIFLTQAELLLNRAQVSGKDIEISKCLMELTKIRIALEDIIESN